jgi:hypothetical protein
MGLPSGLNDLAKLTLLASDTSYFTSNHPVPSKVHLQLFWTQPMVRHLDTPSHLVFLRSSKLSIIQRGLASLRIETNRRMKLLLLFGEQMAQMRRIGWLTANIWDGINGILWDGLRFSASSIL